MNNMTNNLDLVHILSRASELNELRDLDPIPIQLPRHVPLLPQVSLQQQPQTVAAMMAMPMPVPSFPIKPLPDDNVKATGKPSAAVGNKPSKKRTWKKPAGKPKRPLSAYNLFFQAERSNIIAERAGVEVAGGQTLPNGAAKGSRDERSKKRPHRRSHGKIGFAALAQTIAAKWKALDEASRKPFEADAAVEKMRYKRELKVWERNQALKKVAAQEEEGARIDDTEEPTEQKEKNQQERPRKRARPNPMPIAATPSSAPGPSSLRDCLDKMEAVFDQLEPIDIKSMHSMIVAPPTKAVTMGAAPAMSLHSMLSTSSVMPSLPVPAVGAPLPDAAQSDSFGASLDAIFGDNLNNVPDVMASLERMDAELDGEFDDFLTAF